MMKPVRFASVVLAAVVGGACGGSRSPAAAATTTAARLAPPEPVVSCAEWVRRAVADPDLAVERVPEPVAMKPPALPKRLPKGVVARDGSAEIRVRVLVDTLGTPDMKTFTVVKSTSPVLTRSVRGAIAKWTFTPAAVGGCKVPRHYNLAAVTPPATAAGTRR